LKRSAWVREHRRDAYVKRASVDGYRSRAAYKLEELDRRYRLLRRGDTVVDLGAAPGGWSQVAARRVGPEGYVLAVDLRPMEPLPGVGFVQGDFGEQEALDALLAILGRRRPAVVMSDMAPDLCGVAAADQARAMQLAELAWELAARTLAPGGSFLVKLFEGAGTREFVEQVRPAFDSVARRKPDASRARSRESYLLSRGFAGPGDV